MSIQSRSSRRYLLFVAMVVAGSSLFVVGCGKSDDTPAPSNGTYFTGQMAKKGGDAPGPKRGIPAEEPVPAAK